MGFLHTLFNTSQEESFSFKWKTLHDISQLERILNDSGARTQVIFKHSIRCGVSSGVLKQFEKKHKDKFEYIDFYYLDIIAHRIISNEIAQRFKIAHQSPQVLIVTKGVVASYASHYAILDSKF